MTKTLIDRAVVEQALVALELFGEPHYRVDEAVEQLRATLAQPERSAQGETLIGCVQHDCAQCRAKWEPLSYERICELDPAPNIMSDKHRIDFARAIEAEITKGQQ